MPGQINVTFRGFTDENVLLNLPLAKKAKLPARKPPGSFEESLIKGGLEGLALVSPKRAPVVKEMFNLGTPPLGVMKVMGSVSKLPIRSPSPDFTVAFGLVAQAGAGAAAGLGGGVYFWNKRPRGEFGLFGTLSVGMMTNIGASVGDSLAFLFGTASSVLAGDMITLEVDIDFPPVTVGGQMFLTAPPVSVWPPALTGAWVPEIVGFGLVLSVGISALPASIAVMPSRTWIKPVTPW